MQNPEAADPYEQTPLKCHQIRHDSKKLAIFNIGMLFAILLQTAIAIEGIISLLKGSAMEGYDEEENPAMMIFGLVSGILEFLFIVEIIVRHLTCYPDTQTCGPISKRYCQCKNWACIDYFSVIVGLLDNILEMIMVFGAVASVRLLRIFTFIVRLLRFIKFVYRCYHIEEIAKPILARKNQRQEAVHPD